MNTFRKDNFTHTRANEGIIQDNKDPHVINCTDVKQDEVVLLKHDSNCSICLEDISVGNWYRTLPNCGHVFHDTCIDEWIIVKGEKCSSVYDVLQQPTCPVCRAGIFASRKNKSSWLSV